MAHECLKEDAILTIKKNIEDLNAIKDVVIELKTLVSILVEQCKQQDETSRKQSEMLIKITETTAQQSEVLKTISDKYHELDNKFTQKRIEELKENSITFNSLIRTLIDKALPPIIIAGLTYLILQIVQNGGV